MPRSQPSSSSRRSSLWLVVLGVFVACAAGIAAFLSRSNETTAPQSIAATPETALPSPAAGKNTGQLLELARTAMHEQRLVEPQGNNAYELYLAVLAQDPANRVAQDALRETFPFAAAAVERSIGDGDFIAAQREIDLLGRADKANYTLVLLRAKLATQQKLAEQEKQPAPVPTRPQPSVVATRQPVAAPTLAVPTPAPAAAAPEPVKVAQLTPPPFAPTHASTAPVLRQSVQPFYPPDAKRTRRQGWVDVQFVVEANGKVSHAVVADADPKYLFDRAAVAAVERWEFSPAMNGNEPVPATLRQRIQFKL